MRAAGDSQRFEQGHNVVERPTCRHDAAGQGVGCDLYLHVQGLDTTTPAGKAMFQMLGVFAEFERSIIKDRIAAGLDRAREQGTKSGRPFGRPTISAKTRDAILAARAEGLSIRETARSAGVSVGKAHAVIKEAEAGAILPRRLRPT